MAPISFEIEFFTDDENTLKSIISELKNNNVNIINETTMTNDVIHEEGIINGFDGKNVSYSILPLNPPYVSKFRKTILLLSLTNSDDELMKIKEIFHKNYHDIFYNLKKANTFKNCA